MKSVLVSKVMAERAKADAPPEVKRPRGRPADPLTRVEKLLRELRADMAATAEADRQRPPVEGHADSIEFLKQVQNDIRQSLDMRIKAAGLVAQYTVKKPGRVGKKETAKILATGQTHSNASTRDAATVGRPRLAATAPPPLRKRA